MSFIDKILVNFGTVKVGKDKFGNQYCVSSSKNYLGHKKRFVIYNGVTESSKVPPMWHAWLHYLTDEVPNYENEMKQFDWQKKHEPNLTGTKYSYDPSKLSDKNPVYESWKPKKINLQ